MLMSIFVSFHGGLREDQQSVIYNIYFWTLISWNLKLKKYLHIRDTRKFSENKKVTILMPKIIQIEKKHIIYKVKKEEY